MKAMLIDSAISGHRLPYMKNTCHALEILDFDYFRVLPSLHLEKETISDIQVPFPKKLNFIQYFLARAKWVKKILDEADRLDIRVIHFLSSDSFYQLGGYGIRQSASRKIVITQHHLPHGFLRVFQFKRLSKKVSLIVVHSQYLKDRIREMGISNEKICVVDYPVFHATKQLSKEAARNFFKIPLEAKVILSIGGTRRGKGLDILLEALKAVHSKFTLVVAGKEEDITLGDIKTQSSSYTDSVICDLRLLTDEEFGYYIDSADCIVLPYRKGFLGASGPMTEAIWRGKTVIGPNHGMIGDLIARYNLGYTFESENISELTLAIESYLDASDQLIINPLFEAYRNKLSVDEFIKTYTSVYTKVLDELEN